MILTLRRLSAADVDAILSIQRASPEAAQWPAAEWRLFSTPEVDTPDEKLHTGYCAWVAEMDGAPVGFLSGLFSGEEIEILNLAVCPPARRAGVASRVLEEALARAQVSGGSRAFLEVRASNTGAIAFYVQHRFRLAGRRKDYYMAPVEDALVLARAL